MHNPTAAWRFKRIIAEPPPNNRSEFERDKDRILHSDAFRRLAGKTQVFVAPQNDHVRNRLSHTIEVAQIAGSIAKRLGFCQDLAEAIAFAHDLGHPPFGHSGETALNAIFADIGGYDHNAQTLRILEKLEKRYLAFDGLNLTNETIDGVIKHNGPVTNATGAALEIYRASAEKRGLNLNTRACVEAQIAAVSDDIAYGIADIQDAVRAGCLTFENLFEQPWIAEMLVPSTREPSQAKRLHDAMRRLMRSMIDNIIATSETAIPEAARIETVRSAPNQTIRFSPKFAQNETALKKFMRDRVYKSPTVEEKLGYATEKLAAVTKAHLRNPSLLPDDWRPATPIAEEKHAAMVRDYIAGMTDQYAFSQYEKLKAAGHL